MKIVLVNPPWFRLQGASLVHYPPGPCHIASALEQINYDSIVWNADFDSERKAVVGGTNIINTDELTRQHKVYQKNLNDLNGPIWLEVREKLKEFNPDILGISVYSCSLKSSLNVAKIAKEINSNMVIIFGGIHPTIDPDGVIKNPEVDYVVVGEGEITIQELIRAIDNKDDVSQIKGIAFKDGDKIIKNERRPAIENLDSLNWPARHKIYQKELFPPSAFNTLYGSRGCPFQCIFCGSFNIWGHKMRTRSAESMVNEIEYVHKTFKTNYFYICDDIFFINKDRAFRFGQLLKEKKLNIYWSLQTRGEIMDDELLAMFKRTGGQHIAIGVETGNAHIRKLIKKGNTLDDIRRAAKLIKKHGLTMVGFFMFGFPWETEKEIADTVNFMKEINPTICFPYIVTPSPGTELSEIAKDMGLIGAGDNLENFYHESPEMCLSVNIPPEKRKDIINKTLKEFALNNRKNLFKDLFRRPKFYWVTAVKDQRLLKNPKVILQYIKDIFF